MDSKEIVSRLAVGSQIIDRMKKEVHETVTMLLGMVTEDEVELWRKSSDCRRFSLHDECRQYFKPAESESEYERGCSWTLIQFSSRRKPEVLCVLLDVVGDTSHYRNSYQSTHPSLLTHENIKRVHTILPLFVEGMVSAFPSLGDKLKPFLEAADYAEKNGW